MFKCQNFPFAWEISWPVKGWQRTFTKQWIKMYFFSVHFNFTSTKSNISCNISLSKTFIVTSREAIYFKFNLSLKSGVIRNHCQITFGLYTEYSECTNDFDTELKSTFISSFAESSLQRACVFQKLECCCQSFQNDICTARWWD